MFPTIFIKLVVLILAGSISSTISAVTNVPQPVRDVSHEDLRDAILTLVHMFRDNTEKLEKNEYRERQLGDQLKKSLQAIEKSQKTSETGENKLQDTLNSIIVKLEKLEANFAKDHESRLTIDSLVSVQNDLNQKLNQIAEVTRRLDSNYEKDRVVVVPKLEAILFNVLQTQSMTSTLEQKLGQAVLAATAAPGSTTENPIFSSVIDKFDSKLSLLDGHKDFLNKLALQQQNLQEQVSQITHSLEQLKSNSHSSCQTSTWDKLEELKQVIRHSNENSSSSIHEQIEKNHLILNQGQKVLLAAFSNTKPTSANYDEFLKEIKSLTKIDQVLIQTADNVLDTKRRIEYGTHQILLEVGEQIKSSAKETNDTINKRFDVISSEIVENQNGAFKNLSTKLETEISQVWRQIGIMYQTLTNSAESLDKLQHQTELYVNGSLITMDNMEGKVGLITSRMSEVDENLNYLLGRLSLVTQEFNQIKTGLGQALDNIRSSFHTVQNKVKDVGPGPNPIPPEELEEIGIVKQNTLQNH